MEVNAWNVPIAFRFRMVSARNSAPEGILYQLMANASALRAISSMATANGAQLIRVHGTVSA